MLFLSKMVYKRIRGCNCGRSLPVIKFGRVPPHPPTHRGLLSSRTETMEQISPVEIRQLLSILRF